MVPSHVQAHVHVCHSGAAPGTALKTCFVFGIDIVYSIWTFEAVTDVQLCSILLNDLDNISRDFLISYQI